MDLNESQVFIEVVKARSFTGAGKKLGVPKSSVSRKVTALEERLGVQLLQRTTRRLSLSHEGEIYFERAAKALEALEEAEREILEDAELLRGVIRITAPSDFGQSEYGRALAEFSEQHPHVQIQVELTQRKVDLVGEGFDLAIRAGRLPDSSMKAKRLGLSELNLYASPEYLEKHGTPTSPAELSNHDCVLFGSAHHQVWQMNKGEEKVEVAVKGSSCANQFSLLVSATVAGAGIALLPNLGNSERVSNGQLINILPGWGQRVAGIFALYPASRHLPSRVRALLDHLSERFSRIIIEGRTTS
ncbi:MAG: LysR family transcriptional regulator [Polyangiaceae bacterium]|nr:LysR family transcriptional regulator [Polyangiaceae bacterium]